MFMIWKLNGLLVSGLRSTMQFVTRITNEGISSEAVLKKILSTVLKVNYLNNKSTAD